MTSIIRNGNVYLLTESEIEEAYREKLYDYRRQDAERQFIAYLGLDPEEDILDGTHEEEKRFKDSTGLCAKNIINNDSDECLLDDFVIKFDECFDCNVAENDTWQGAIRRVIDDAAK